MMLLLGFTALLGALALVALALPGGRVARSDSARAVAMIAHYSGDTGPTSGARPRRHPFAAVLALGRGLADALTRPAARATLQRRLDLAGNPAGWSAERVLAAKGCGLLGGALLGALLPGSIAAALPAALVAGAAGFALPDLLLYNTGLKRQERLQRSLADALDLLVISVQAGLGFDAALSQVARNTKGPLAGEFNRVLQEMQLGKSRREAFTALSDRTTSVDVRHFVGAVVQADTLGVPMTGVLEQQAAEMRLRRRQAAEAQAQKVPVKILLPLMSLVLPALFIVVLGPAALVIIESFSGT